MYLNTLELKDWLCSCRELVSLWRYDFAVSKDSMFHTTSRLPKFIYIPGMQSRLEQGFADRVRLIVRESAL